MESRKVNALASAMFVALVLLTSCTTADQGEKANDDTTQREAQGMTPERVYIQVSDTASFREDFEEAVKNGDTRFVGVMGYSLEVPGVPDYEEKYSKSHGVKVIEGTSDSYPDSASLARNVFYRDYATGYNELLLRHLGDQH